MEPEVTVADEPLDGSVARALILRLNAELDARYPEPGANHFQLDPGEVAPGRGAFVVARMGAGGEAVGCGAFRFVEPGVAEIKRMFVDPAARGAGIGRRVLEALESRARAAGARRLVLETGDRQIEAVALYTRAGFLRIPAFGEYVDSPLSVCMGKDL